MFRIEHHVYFHTGSDPVLAILMEIKGEVITLKPEIAALKAKMSAFSALLVAGFATMNTSFATAQGSLDNIKGDIAKLQLSASLTDEDKATLGSIGDGLDTLTTQFAALSTNATSLGDSAKTIAEIVPDDAPVVDPPVVDPPVVDPPVVDPPVVDPPVEQP